MKKEQIKALRVFTYLSTNQLSKEIFPRIRQELKRDGNTDQQTRDYINRAMGALRVFSYGKNILTKDSEKLFHANLSGIYHYAEELKRLLDIDNFAGLAMQSLINQFDMTADNISMFAEETIAKMAYQFADAMLKERI